MVRMQSMRCTEPIPPCDTHLCHREFSLYSEKNREARTGRSIRTILALSVIRSTDQLAPRSANVLGAEGAAATTGGLRLRVLDREPRPLEAVHVIDFGSLQERSALRIHNDLDDTLFDHGVVIAHLRLEGHPVLIPVASTALDLDPQANDVLLFHHQFLDLLFCNRCNRQHCAPPRVTGPSFEDLPGMI